MPLCGVRVDAEISGLCALVEVTQHYANREPVPIEAVYVFPLDESAAICGFDAQIDDVLVVGRIEERSSAFDEYDRAIAAGHGALLLDEERPDVFKASIGNVPPGKDVRVRIRYVTELRADGGSVRFVVPATVSPRYIPADDHSARRYDGAGILTPPLAWHVPYGLDINVRLRLGWGTSEGGGNVRTPSVTDRASLESPSHPIRVTWQDDLATVSLAHAETALDRDFVLAVDARELATPHAWIESAEDGTTAIAVAFCPRLADVTLPSEVIFIVDRSGSMAGSSIAEVRKALRLCLHSMVPGSRFNIIGFGSSVAPLFPESRGYDDATLRRAGDYVDSLQADLGGTEILPALQVVLDAPRTPLVRNVVLLTDGQVSNTDAVLALAAAHADRSRIFTFGIGAGASHHLVRGLARVSGGVAEFIYPGERIEPKVVRQLGRLSSPALTDVRVDWQGLGVTQAPTTVPPVFSGSRLILYGLARTIQPATIRLTASSASGPVSFEVPVSPSAARPGTTIATLAARERIRELEESPEWTVRRGSRQARGSSRVSSEIIELSKRYSLISRETSFVAIEQRTTPVIGDMQLRRVPVALTTGWGCLAHPTASTPMALASARAPGRMAAPSFMADLASVAMRDPDDDDSGLFSQAIERASRGFDRMRQAVQNLSSGGPKPDGSPQLRAGDRGVANGMHAVVHLQRADGSWDLTRDLASAIGQELAALRAAGLHVPGTEADSRPWATALAIAWLREHAAADEAEWQFLVRKAMKWLDGVLGAAASAAWLEAARDFMTSPQFVVRSS